MAKNALFVILICSIHGFGAEDIPPPKLTASRSVIIETDSVTLNCEGPRFSSVSECSFYTRSGGILHDFLCNQTLTGTKLLQMANRSSPAQVELSCCHTILSGTTCSVYSQILSIDIQTLPSPKFTVSSAEITDTDSVTLTCEAPSSVFLSACYFYFLVESEGVEGHSSCQKTLTGTQLLEMANVANRRLPVKVKVNCRYTAKPGQVYSPYCNLTSIFIQNKMEMKTDLTTNLFPRKISTGAKSDTDKVSDATSSSTPLSVSWIVKIVILVLTGVGSAVGIILLSFTFVIYKRADNLKDSRQPGEVKPSGTHQAYMIITTSDYPPADFQVQNMQENENYDPDTFYHTYSTIPD